MEVPGRRARHLACGRLGSTDERGVFCHVDVAKVAGLWMIVEVEYASVYSTLKSEMMRAYVLTNWHLKRRTSLPSLTGGTSAEYTSDPRLRLDIFLP
jgi:hypothetical protein